MSMRTAHALFTRLFAVGLLIGCCLNEARAQAVFNPDLLMDGQDRSKIIHVTVNGKTASGGDVPAISGTGFFISPDGFALTAAHLFYSARNVLDPASRLTGPATGKDFIQGRLGYASESPKAFQLVQLFPETDVALIQLIDPPKTPYFKLCSARPAIVDQLYGFGFTAGLVLNTQPGTIGGALVRDRYPVSMAINPGMSGGPIISRSGKVFAMAVSGVREPDFESYNFVRSVQFMHPALDMARVKEECDASPAAPAGQPPATSSADAPAKSKKLLAVYVDYAESDTAEANDVVLNAYRESLLEELFRLVQDTSIIPYFTGSYNQNVPLKEIFKQYFIEQSPNPTDVNRYLKNFRRPAGGNNVLFYFLQLKKMPFRVAGSELMIKAMPWLLDVQFASDNLNIVNDVPLRAEKVMLLGTEKAMPQSEDGVYAASAREHAKLLLPQLALVGQFSREVVFIDCVDFQVFEANRPPWRYSALSDLKQQLMQNWTAKPEFQPYKAKLREARTELAPQIRTVA